jgi:hypothetical protein
MRCTARRSRKLVAGGKERNTPRSSEEQSQAQAEAVRIAGRYLETGGAVLDELILVTVRFIPKDDPFAVCDRDTWMVCFEKRCADPHLHPNGAIVLVDGETKVARGVTLM